MNRILLAVAIVLMGALPASAQVAYYVQSPVMAYYAPPVGVVAAPVPVTAYYAPAAVPVTTYRAPRVVMYGAPPAVPVQTLPAPVPYVAGYAPAVVAAPAIVDGRVVTRSKYYPYGQPVRNVFRALVP